MVAHPPFSDFLRESAAGEWLASVNLPADRPHPVFFAPNDVRQQLRRQITAWRSGRCRRSTWGH
jgi:hypothetical protein